MDLYILKNVHVLWITINFAQKSKIEVDENFEISQEILFFSFMGCFRMHIRGPMFYKFPYEIYQQDPLPTTAQDYIPRVSTA